MTEWRTTTLGQVVRLQRGHDLPFSQRSDGPYPVIGSGGVTGYHNERKAAGPGITIGRAANLGVPTLTEQDFWPLNTTLYVTDFMGNDVRFIYHLFQTLDLAGYNSGSVQPMLNRNYIQNVPVTIPEPSGQRAISEVLGALDDKIAVNERTVATAFQLGDSLFARWQLSYIGTFPTLGDLARTGRVAFGDGYRTKRSEHGHPGLPILRVADIGDGEVHPADGDRVSLDHLRAMGAKRSQADDVVLTTKGTVGRVAIVPGWLEEHVYSPQVCFFRPTDPGMSPFLFFYLRSDNASGQMEWMKNKTDMAAYISLSDLKALRVPWPEGDTSLHLAKLGTLVALVQQNQAESRTLAELRDTLLPKLMSGELRIRDAEEIVGETT